MDIGECEKIHDLALRADYEQASESKDYGYQVDVSISHAAPANHVQYQLNRR